MNPRIRKLAEQAFFDDATSQPSDRMYTFSDHKMQKFAELIVRECVKESMEEIVSDEDIAQENDPSIREYLKGNNQGIVDAVVRFRNHFGVKE